MEDGARVKAASALCGKLKAAVDDLAKATYAAAVEYFLNTGRGDPLMLAARRAVAARHDHDDGAWNRLKAALDELEDIVGRPTP